ncbi:MAG: hypothetical protein NTW07_07955 [candidate division Zixibacteria bacterium]|nr:hypothetical protein [candidate division Zixibacteria bacterium]
MTNKAVFVLLMALGCLALAVMFSAGFAKKLEGNTYENEKPIVWFVNVPPEGARSSVNPIVNWYGQDRDGQIDFYRYVVVREDVIGDSLGKASDWNPVSEPLTAAEIQSFVDNQLGTFPDSLWTVLLVRADSTDPHSSNIIPMSAQMDDPVRTFVPQLVFVQAVDEEGLGSDIVFRRFLRNDNPPNTRIVAFLEGTPFINSVRPSGPATGVKVRWQGTDAVDYPTDPPPFEYEWKLFGPYDSAEYAQIIDSFLVPAFVTNDARVFRFNQPPDTVGYDTFWGDPGHTIIDSIRPILLPSALIVCDTTYVGGVEVENCDTILIDTLRGSNVYGSMDTLLAVYDEDFINSPYYTVVDSSRNESGGTWVTDMRDSIYNVYWNHPADTTQVGHFIFAVRSRDDAHVPDLTPAWRGFVVVDPRHERDILVMDWGLYGTNTRNEPNTEELSGFYWDTAIHNWIEQTGHAQVQFADSIDVFNVSDYMTDNKMLYLILKYKVAIMLQDAIQSGQWSGQQEAVQWTFVALQTGVNVFVNMRVPLGNHSAPAAPASVDIPSANYQYFFGVQQYTFPGWGSYVFSTQDGIGPEWGYGLPRTEDFVGTLSLDEERWPELTIDSARLHEYYEWRGSTVPLVYPWYGWRSELAALPQVGWVVRTFDTECMYLYKSLYGAEHGIISTLSFHGRPVGIRLNRGLFRTVHFLFSPMAMEQVKAQEMVNGVLSWLYDGRVVLSPGERDTRQQALSSELSDRYWKCYWEADGDRDKFFELLKNAY